MFYNLIEYHFKVLIFGSTFLLNIVDLFLNAYDVVIFVANIDKFALKSVRVFLGCEEELTVVEGLTLVNLDVDLLIVIFLAHGELIVLVNKNLTFPFELFEIVKERVINFLYSIDDDTDEDIVWTQAFFDELINVISNTP